MLPNDVPDATLVKLRDRFGPDAPANPGARSMSPAPIFVEPVCTKTAELGWETKAPFGIKFHLR